MQCKYQLEDSYRVLTTQSWLATYQITAMKTNPAQGTEKSTLTLTLFPLPSFKRTQIKLLVSFSSSRRASYDRLSIPLAYCLHNALRSELPLSLLPCLFLPTQACKGRALQLIRDLPVEFHYDKGSYSCRQDGEQVALPTALALLGGVSKMKRLHFEACLLPKTPKLWTRMHCCSSFSVSPFPWLVFCHPSSSVALQSGSLDLSQSLSHTDSTGAKQLTPYLSMLSSVSLSGVSMAFLTHIPPVHFSFQTTVHGTIQLSVSLLIHQLTASAEIPCENSEDDLLHHLLEKLSRHVQKLLHFFASLSINPSIHPSTYASRLSFPFPQENVFFMFRKWGIPYILHVQCNPPLPFPFTYPRALQEWAV